MFDITSDVSQGRALAPIIVLPISFQQYPMKIPDASRRSLSTIQAEWWFIQGRIRQNKDQDYLDAC